MEQNMGLSQRILMWDKLGSFVLGIYGICVILVGLEIFNNNGIDLSVVVFLTIGIFKLLLSAREYFRKDSTPFVSNMAENIFGKLFIVGTLIFSFGTILMYVN